MMDKQNVNGFHPKASMNGHQGRQVPYSVETPYGFRLDLDFLKYVDDIEKGNTIRRIPIQRRSRGSKFSALHRNFSLPGYNYRVPWASTPALGANAKSRLIEEFDSCEHGLSRVSESPPVSYVTLRTVGDASTKAFDEQALGVHVRPYLLRATSMPVTTLQRTSSEASDDRAASASGGLCSENGSIEDVFGERGNGSSSSDPGLRLQLAAALQRIGELEEQARTVTELNAQIRALREDKDRLLLRLQPCAMDTEGRGGLSTEGQPWHPHLQTLAESRDSETVSCIGQDELPSLIHVHETICEEGHYDAMSRLNDGGSSPLSITALQERIADLDQKLWKCSMELKESSTLLKEQMKENQLKENRIKQLTERRHVEPVANQDTAASGSSLTCSSTQTDATTATGNTIEATTQPEAPSSMCDQVIHDELLESPRSPIDKVHPGSPEAGCTGELLQKPNPLEPNVPFTNTTTGLSIARIQALLQEQWECICGEDPDDTLKQPGSKVSSIQAELLNSIQTLSSLCSSHAQTAVGTNQAALKSIMKKSASTEGLGASAAKKNLKFVGVNGGYETTSSEDSSSEESVEEQRSEEREEDAVGGQEGGAGESDAGLKASDREGSPNDQSDIKPRVDEDFTAACCYLKDHLEEAACPDEKMRQVLTVLYQVWFHVSSEGDCTAEMVALYLEVAQSFGPAVLSFLVNLADGNDNMALHYSVSHSNFAIVKLLLETGMCDVNHRNKAGYTAIMLASLTAADSPEDMEVVQQLIEQADVNAQSSQAGQTALMLAVSHGRTMMVRLLLAGKADINVQNRRGSTPLMCACEHGFTEIVSLLLEHGDCDTNLTDNEGGTALSVALSSSNSEIADLLRAYNVAGTQGSTRPL